MIQRFLMSPPGVGWRIAGGENHWSRKGKPVDSEAAYEEWETLYKAVTRAGGSVQVLHPQKYSHKLMTGLPYAANWGHFFRRGNLFLLSRMKAEHRKKEAEVVRRFLRSLKLGWQIDQSQSIWEGQADICPLGEDEHLIAYGVRSDEASVLEIGEHLISSEAPVPLPVKIIEPFFHGDTCLNPIATPSGPVILVFKGAFANPGKFGDFKNYFPDRYKVVEIGEQDALSYACNGLPVNDTFIYPRGVSDALLLSIENQGMKLVEIHMPNLFEAGGGPRCLVNRLTSQTF